MAPSRRKGLLRFNGPDERPQKRQKFTVPSAPDVRRVPVAMDSLPWNEVQLPDMHDDAEGFFGLEEVENVEIIKDGNKIQFVSLAANSRIEDDDVFEGFDDDDIVTAENSTTQTENEATKTSQAAVKNTENGTKKEDNRKPKKRELQASADNTNNASTSSVSNAFALLENDKPEGEVDISEWVPLELSSEILTALEKLRFSNPTPIQRAAIPEILEGHDVIGKAATGSGKTLAFGIPIVENWLQSHHEDAGNAREHQNPPTALILSPTRELAHQLAEHLKALCSGLSVSPRIVVVTGGLSIQKQQRQLEFADIIVATPGRLWEVVSSSSDLSNAFKQIKFLVVDEADRLLAEGHFKEAEELISALDYQVDANEVNADVVPQRQTLIFSATFDKKLQHKLAGKGKYAFEDDEKSMEYLLKKLNFREDKPKFVDVNPISQMAGGLREGMVECAGTEKDLYLYALLLYHPNQRTLIFANSIHSVRRLAPLLQTLGLPAHALHSQMPQKARLRTIERFSSTRPSTMSPVLVATDVAARGLDITDINLVIHYHLPRTADMYVHRSGRTARAAASGSSILLCAPEEVVAMRRLVAKVHAKNAVEGGGNKKKYYMRSLDLDRKVVSRLRQRVSLAKKIADSALAKEKKGLDDQWVRNAAEELGVDYDSDEFEAAGGGRKGRGTGRKMKEKEARGLSKGEVGALRSELKSLLAQRVNVGVSERYLTSGRVDIEGLLRGTTSNFIGALDDIGLIDE